jgi:hypothetical protein
MYRDIPYEKVTEKKKRLPTLSLTLWIIGRYGSKEVGWKKHSLM